MVVPGLNGQKVNSAVEDVRPAVANDELAMKHQQAIDELKASTDESVSELPGEPAYQSSISYDDDNSDPGEIGPTQSLSVSDQFDIFWPLDG